MSQLRRSASLALIAIVVAVAVAAVYLLATTHAIVDREAGLRSANAARAATLAAAGDGRSAAATLAAERTAVEALHVPNTGPALDALERAVQRHDVMRARIADADLGARLDVAAAEADAVSLRIELAVIVSAAAAIVLAVGAFVLHVRSGALAERALRAQESLASSRGAALATVQRALLNRELPAEPALGLHGRYVPAASEMRVGGDWYDVIRLPDRRVFVSIGDVAGHGLEAAVHMDAARQAILAAALHENDPAEILARANLALLSASAPMVTAICGFVDPVLGDVVYATAGHPPPLLIDGVQTRFLAYDGLPLGVIEDAGYVAFSEPLRVGAMLVLYTDGLIEHKNDIIEGERRLLEAARRAYGTTDPAAEIERHVFGARTAADDVAILAVVMRDEIEDGATVTARRANRLAPL